MKRYGIVFADEMEYKPFYESAVAAGGNEVDTETHRKVVFPLENCELIGIESGIGKVNAAVAALSLIIEDDVDGILNAGLSGAVSHLRKGDIVVGTQYEECDFDLRPLGMKLGQKPDGSYIYYPDGKFLEAAKKVKGIKEAKLGTGDIFLTDSDLKKAYNEEFGVMAFDMETGALAAVCNRYDVPFLSIRKISDDADDEAVDSYRELNDLAETALTEVLLETVRNL